MKNTSWNLVTVAPQQCWSLPTCPSPSLYRSRDRRESDRSRRHDKVSKRSPSPDPLAAAVAAAAERRAEAAAAAAAERKAQLDREVAARFEAEVARLAGEKVAEYVATPAFAQMVEEMKRAERSRVLGEISAQVPPPPLQDSLTPSDGFVFILRLLPICLCGLID